MLHDEDIYRQFFLHAVEGIFRTTPDGAYLSVNPALATMYGYDSPDDLMAHLTNVEQQLYVQPGRRREFVQAMRRFGKINDFESEVYRKDGSTIWITERARAVYDDDGSLACYEGVVSNITRRKVAEEKLRESEEKLRLLLNALPDLIFRIARDGTYLDFIAGHHSELYLPPEQFLGRRIDEVMPPDVAILSMHNIARALESGTLCVFEYQLAVQETMRDYEVRLVQSGDDEVLAIARDITERKRVERFKNEFVSIVSHELRTPLTSIRGSLGLVVGAMAADLPPRTRSMIEIAHKNSERLVSLVNDILDIDKIESGKMVFDLKPANLVALAEHAIDANRAFGEQFGVSFCLHHPDTDTDMQVNIDSNRIMQVFTNLLSNAAKFSPQGSSVEVRVRRAGTGVRVEVQDHGPGIPDEFRARIFQKFAQADSSDIRKKGGTGLGLSISKAIVERHNGRIGFESNTGVGTTFFFELPEWHDQAKSYSSLHHQPRILICEDTPDLATMLSLVLGYHGFNTDIAYNTTQARQLLAENQYAAMTLDLVMPGQGGIDFIRDLRREERTRDLPIIVVSALAQHGRGELEGGAFQVVDWLDKPVDQERLIASVRRAVALRPAGTLRILHIEDDPDVVEVLTQMLQAFAEVDNAPSVAAARQRLADGSYHLVILDLGLPDGSGLELLPLLRDPHRKPIPVMIFSAQDVGQDTAQKVAAVLIKSRTTNTELVNAIKSLIGDRE